MNPPGWPGLGHTSNPFLLPHMGMHVQNNFNPNSVSGVHRFLTTTPLPGSQDQVERPSEQQQQQGGGGDNIQQVNTVPVSAAAAPEEGRSNTTTHVIDVHVPFQPLRQISVDLMTNWPEPDQQQPGNLSTHEQQQLPFDASESDGVAQNDALQHFQNQLESDLDNTVSKGTPQKRKRNAKPMPETWKKNVRKAKRAKGETYQSATGKMIPAKSIKYVDCSKCRLRCSETISDEQRNKIFESYWGTGSYVRQRDFLCSHIFEEEKARCTVKGESSRKREWTRQYWLPNKSGKLHRVCKSFFLATLDVGSKTIDYALKKRIGGFFCDDDQRGKHEPTNKVSEDKLDFIRNHIESFRNLSVSPNKKKKNGRIVLPSDLNIRKMYQLYKDAAEASGHPVQKEHVYRRIFNMEYNITFQEVKKDGKPPDEQTPSQTVSTAPASAPIFVVKSAEQSHHNLITKHIEQVQMEANQNNQQIKERNRQIHLMKSQTQTNSQQQAGTSQQSGDSVHTSLQQHAITSHAMPQYSSAPPPPAHFVLQSNHSRPLDAVNMSMSQFPVHPTFLHHHHANN